MIQVLVIEDDRDTAAEIVQTLSASGYEVDAVDDGLAGYDLACRAAHDVITLDRLLPGLDGLTVLGRLRNNGIRTPILLLSGLSEVDERVRGLRAGGDDYLVKPFVSSELSARVEALARRPPATRPTRLEIGDLSLDLVARSAKRGDRHLDLAPREFRLLEFLMTHAGKTVTRAMLFEDVWHYRFDPGTNLVDVHIGRLRRKVDRTHESTIIRTVRKVGFALIMPEDKKCQR